MQSNSVMIIVTFLLNYGNSYVKEGYYLNINSNNKLLKYEIDSFFWIEKRR